jgi:hypothetical protein
LVIGLIIRSIIVIVDRVILVVVIARRVPSEVVVRSIINWAHVIRGQKVAVRPVIVVTIVLPVIVIITIIIVHVIMIITPIIGVV